MDYFPQAFISIQSLKHNFQQVRKYAPESKIMSMVKANAYGHGLLQVANALSESDAFGVTNLDEGLALKNSGVKKSVVIMRGFSTEEELCLISDKKLEVLVHNEEQLKILEKVKLSNAIRIWLKIDTGMHRLGFLPSVASSAYKRLQKNKNVIDTSIMSHFSDASLMSQKKSLCQLKEFQEISFNMKGLKSIAASGAIINFSKSHLDWVRPGIMLYGVSPITKKTGGDFDLKSVMMLKSKLIATKELKKGDCVGYGGKWRCPENMLVGIVAIGYADGYPRSAKNGTPVLVNNIRCGLIGRVSMDMLAIDLRNNANAKCGDNVVLWGGRLPIEEVAEYSSTIPYELFCNLTRRVQFMYSE